MRDRTSQFDHHDKLLLRAPEAARLLSISERLLWSQTRAGKVPHVRIGHSVRYPMNALRKLCEVQQ